LGTWRMPLAIHLGTLHLLALLMDFMAVGNQMGSSDRGYNLDQLQDKMSYISLLQNAHVLINSTVSKLISCA
jgi:hypothetical protein